jgi:hypothetical protein
MQLAVALQCSSARCDSCHCRSLHNLLLNTLYDVMLTPLMTCRVQHSQMQEQCACILILAMSDSLCLLVVFFNAPQPVHYQLFCALGFACNCFIHKQML